MEPAAVSGDLAGLGVLVTRPEPQAAQLCRRIEAAAGSARSFPAIEIQAVPETAALRRVLDDIGRYDIALFISANAVHFAFAQPQLRAGLPRALCVGAVGQATALALQQCLGWAPQLLPESGFDSEALLALPELQRVAGRRTLIFRGEGGRELLGDTLRQRGGRVDYAEVYRRGQPRVGGERLASLWKQADIVVATSCESLDNLVQLLAQDVAPWWLLKPLLVISSRMQEHAHAIGFRRVVRAEHAADDAVLQALRGFVLDRPQPGR